MFGFYRTMPMHSVDYAVKRCLSISLLHASILSKWLNISAKFFSPSGSQTILVFPNQMAIHLMGAWNTRGYEKITIFDQYLALSQP